MTLGLEATLLLAGGALLYYGGGALLRRLRAAGPRHGHVIDALKALGLDGRYHGVTPVDGRVDGVRVRIAEISSAEPDERPRDPHVRVVVTDELVLPVRISAEALVPALVRGADTLTGEPRFDERVRVDAADPVPALALLDAETRDLVAAAVADGATYDGRRWALSIADRSWDGARIAQAVRLLARVHRQLARASERDGIEGVAALAAGDRHAGVRHRALTLLIERGVASRELLRSRTTDVDASIRYVAARALGADGVGTLRTLVRGGSRSWKVRAATALSSLSLPPDAVRETEEVLVGALDDAELADAALLGLARVGTARCIEALKRVAAEGGTADLRRAARDVLAQVRGRLDPARAGGLSVVDAVGGELAEAADGGGLSVVREPE